MPEGAGFCHKCGSQLPQGATFCPKCGAAVVSQAAQPSVQRPPTPYMGEKGEKHEKREKREKGEKGEKGGAGGEMLGALVGGFVLIWLGITFFLQQNGYLPANLWWAYFILGIGAVLVLWGVAIYARGHVGIGPVIGGAILLLGGVSAIATSNFRFATQFWPLIVVVLGVLVIVGGLASRRRVPAP